MLFDTKTVRISPDVLSDKLSPNCILNRESIRDIIVQTLNLDVECADKRDFQQFCFDLYLSLSNFICCTFGAFNDLIVSVCEEVTE